MHIVGVRLHVYGSDLNNLPLVYPPDVTKIYWYSTKQLPAVLPSKLTHIYFIYSYIHKITNLPDTVTHLSFQGHYPDNLEVPDHITHLEILGLPNYKSIKLPKNIRELRGTNITYISFIFPDNNINIKTLRTNVVSIPQEKSIRCDWLYYLLYCYVSDTHTYITQRIANNLIARCDINRHNMRIKQMAFYDLLL